MICLYGSLQRTANILAGTHGRLLERSFLKLDGINWCGFLLLLLNTLSSCGWLLEGAYILGIGCYARVWRGI
jgi:hypothetical protein